MKVSRRSNFLQLLPKTVRPDRSLRSVLFPGTTERSVRGHRNVLSVPQERRWHAFPQPLNSDPEPRRFLMPKDLQKQNRRRLFHLNFSASPCDLLFLALLQGLHCLIQETFESHKCLSNRRFDMSAKSGRQDSLNSPFSRFAKLASDPQTVCHVLSSSLIHRQKFYDHAPSLPLLPVLSCPRRSFFQTCGRNRGTSSIYFR